MVFLIFLKFLSGIIIIILIFYNPLSADRLPIEVSENQIFTLDTLIDSIGIVTEESNLDWVIESENEEKGTEINYVGKEYYYDGAMEIDDALIDELLDKYYLYGLRLDVRGVFVVDTGEFLWYLTYLKVPDSIINEPIHLNGNQMPIGNLIDSLKSNQNYRSDSFYDGGKIHDSPLNVNEEIAIISWTDSLRSNGGQLSLNKNIDFDSQNKGKELSNLEVEKVLTFAGTDGSHLIGAEKWSLDVAGGVDVVKKNIRCVFSSNAGELFPAFCNVVKSKSELVNINTAQISTKGSIRAVAETGNIPSALNYQIAVSPNIKNESDLADGTVKTLFGGSIMEAREGDYEQSSINKWKETASVTGGIKNFQKSFTYESGFKF